MADLMETATNAGNFQTLIQAIVATELGDLLKSPGPYTVFAPTDDAFAKLPPGTLDSLLLNLQKLKRILSYHVVPGDVRAEDLNQIDEAATMEGSVLAIAATEGLQVNDANVVKPDIITDNGVIHAIDTVLIPALVAAEYK